MIVVAKLLVYICRGPAYGNRGKVVLVFKENESSKIGVRFDESIPEGNNLGGRCEPDHGFFCAGAFLTFVLSHVLLEALPLYSTKTLCIGILFFSIYH